MLANLEQCADEGARKVVRLSQPLMKGRKIYRMLTNRKEQVNTIQHRRGPETVLLSKIDVSLGRSTGGTAKVIILDIRPPARRLYLKIIYVDI